MLTINMITRGDNVAGQGVGAATHELIHLLEHHAHHALRIQLNTSKRADIAHVHTVHPLSYTQMVMAHQPRVMHVHFLPDTLEGSIQLSPPFDKLFANYVLKMYKTAEELVVVNPIFIQDLVRYGFDPAHITYLPNVVNPKAFYPIDTCDALTLERYDIDPNTFNIISVGQVQTRKGVSDFIDVAKKLPQYQFYWAGGFSFGAFTDGYKELKESMEAPPENVHFLDIVPREEMNALYNAVDVLFMPSYAELFPMAVIEAVNSGLPVLLRDLPLYEVIYFTDYLRGKNNDEFAKQLVRLAEDPVVYNRAKACSAKIAADYAPETIAEKWIAYYSRIAAPHRNQSDIS